MHEAGAAPHTVFQIARASVADADWSRLTIDARAAGVTLGAGQVSQLRTFTEMLVEWNERFNLTAIHSPDEILTKHLLDSLACRRIVDFSGVRTLIDVGTGAGFPGVVLKIAYPHIRVTLLDALRKRLLFLDRVVEELQLEGVSTLHSRAEDAACGAADRALEDTASSRRREAYDVAVARAVARLNVLSEWILPFVRVGGCALAMKGPDVTEELREASRAIRLLGGGEPQVVEFSLGGAEMARSLVRIPKVTPTPACYPRRSGTARREPL